METTGATKKLADFVNKTTFNDIPKEVVDYSKLCILDWFGVTLGGLREEIAPILIDFVKEIGGEQQATILGKGIKTSVLNAAFVNGTLSHVLDFDDVNIIMMGHPTVPLFPAVLAMGEYISASGIEVLTAFILGFDVQTRIGAATGMNHYETGWHATGTIGRFGAAAAAGKLLNLDPEKLVYALGIAGTSVAGVRQVFGTMTKSFHPGKAAMDGVMAALLAKRGFTCSTEIIEGKQGFLEIYSKAPDVSKIFDRIGDDYLIVETGFKPYASCRATHATIDAVKSIRNMIDLKAEQIEEIQLEVPKFVLDPAGKTDPKTGLEGKFSVYHCAALAAMEGVAGEDRFTDERVNDPVIVDLRKRVKAQSNEELPILGAKVSIRMKDGKEYSQLVTEPKGDPTNPMTFQEMEDKFRGLASFVLPESNITKLIEKIKYLENVSDINEVVTLCSPT